MRVGITGHQELEDVSQWDWVKAQFHSLLHPYNNALVGLSSLAIGADQYFAQAILDLGGKLEAIIPFQGYEKEFDEEDRLIYFRLLRQAQRMTVLQASGSKELSFYEAGKTIVKHAQIMIAVWDGEAAAGLGGTADIVKFAFDLGVPVIHLNPLTETLVKYNHTLCVD